MMLSPLLDNIPDELKKIPQWVNWRLVTRSGDKPTKPPYQPDGKMAKTSDRSTWSTFSVVADAAPNFSGVGFVLTQDNGVVALDFDKCHCPAYNLTMPDVTEHIRRIDSYAEYSPSKRGFRVFLRATMPVDGQRNGNTEAYQAGRYVTVTGHMLAGSPRTIEHRQEALDAFMAEAFQGPEKAQEPLKTPKASNTSNSWPEVKEKAFASKHGEEVRRLWDGDFSAYPSQSEADLALCHHLAYWLSGDAVKIDSAFRASGLMRNKWDVKHHGGARTYGEATIQKAIVGCTSFFTGHTQKEPEAWPEPIPLSDYSRLPVFPVDAVPGVCGEMVQMLADSCQVDAGLPGCMMLAALSASIGAPVQVVLVSHIEEAAVLYILPVIGSGNRKSEVVKQIAAPLYAFQKARHEAMLPKIRAAEGHMKVLEKRLDRLQKDAASKDDVNERNALVTLCDEVMREMAAHPVPVKPVYLVDDISPEKLGVVMAENGERCAVLSAEGELFKMLAGRYTKGGANIGLVLKAHSGEAWASGRIGRESQEMMNPGLTLGLAVQPDVLEEIGKNSEFRGRGLSARFLYSWCQSRAGYRTLQPSSVSEIVRQDYHRLMTSLMAVEGRHELRLAHNAQALWNDFYNDVELLLRPGNELEHLVDWGSKLPGAVARIAGLLHFAEHGPDGIGKSISGDTVGKACYLGAYFIEHAKASFGIMKEDARLTVARKILSYIKRCSPARFRGSELFNHTSCASMDEIQSGLDALLERGYIREADKKATTGRGRPAQEYDVNPKLISNW